MSKFLSFLNISKAFKFYPLGASAWLVWVIFVHFNTLSLKSGDFFAFSIFILLPIIALEPLKFFNSSHLKKAIILKALLLFCIFVLAFGIWHLLMKSFFEFGFIIWNFMMIWVFIALRIKSCEDFLLMCFNFCFALLLLILWTILFLYLLYLSSFVFNINLHFQILPFTLGLALCGLIFLARNKF